MVVSLILLTATILTLTNWGRSMHVCIIKQAIIGLDNGLSPGRLQAIIWTNVGILLIGPLGTNISEILIKIFTFSFKKMYLKRLSGKWWTVCLGLNVLTSSSSPETSVLTLHHYIYLIKYRNEEMLLKIFLYIADQIQEPTYHMMLAKLWFFWHCYFTYIPLCFVVIKVQIFSEMEALCTAGLTWYTWKVQFGPYRKIHDEIDMQLLLNPELLTRTWHKCHMTYK